MSCLGKIDERAAVPVRHPIIGQTIGNLVAGGIEEERQKAALNSAFSQAASDPSVQAAAQQMANIENVSYDPNKPLTPQQLMAILNANTSGLSAQDTISTIKGNIGNFISQAQQSAALSGQSDTLGQALAANSALVATYSAIGLTMPNFQWTFVGAFMAVQVRQQLITINDVAAAGALGGLVPGITSRAIGDHLINTLISGQIGVVEDIGSLAFAYKDVGAGILSALPVGSSGYKGFQSQIAADADAARGNYAGAAFAGEQAAVQLGIREQTGLQSMWNDPILSFAAKGMNLIPGLLDTSVHTPIGNIAAPAGANDVTNLQDRIAIANHAFGYMYQKLFTGNNAANWNKIDSTLMAHMNSATLPQRPKILGFQI